MKVEFTHDELVTLAVVLVSPWTVTEAVYPHETEERQKAFATELMDIRDKILAKLRVK